MEGDEQSRDYCRGNWSLPETMLLIEAKRKVREERHPGDHGLSLWRWVEDYCWRAGCRRSHNQCNDRWDNLMRDYKKVRAYEMAASGGGGAPSYWAMSRSERKERGLPSNLLREIYDAMGEVLERTMRMSIMTMGGAGAGVASSTLLDLPMQASPLAQVLPRPLPLEQETRHQGHGAAHFSSESPERKRRRPSVDELRRPGGTGSSTPPAPAGTRSHHRQEQGHHHHHHEDNDDHGGEEGESSECSDEDEDEDEDKDGSVLSGAIGQFAAILSGALESREAAEERRHREVLAMEERRGRARQARREAGEQCVAGLAAAVNQLAGSMLALAADNKRRGKGGGPAAPK